MPPADKGKDKEKPKGSARPRRRPATPRKPPAETNGHNQWPDFEAKTDSWDPWDEGGEDGPGEGVNRTLGEWLEAVVPPEAQLHFFNAGKEFAAGIQTTLDYHLHRDGDDDGEGAGALRIDIE